MHYHRQHLKKRQQNSPLRACPAPPPPFLVGLPYNSKPNNQRKQKQKEKARHSPVVRPVLPRAVADGEDAVVELGSTRSGEDARAVELEGHLVGLDGDRDGTHGGEGLHQGLVGGVHLRPFLDLRRRHAKRHTCGCRRREGKAGKRRQREQLET